MKGKITVTYTQNKIKGKEKEPTMNTASALTVKILGQFLHATKAWCQSNTETPSLSPLTDHTRLS